MRKVIFLMTCFITLLSFKSSSQITVEDGQIAPDFPTFSGTLLILECRDFRDNTLNKMTKKKFEKFYKGEFEMITEDDLLSKAYSDKKKFRFLVQLRNSRSIERGGSSNGNATDATKFVMTDRTTDKKFETRTYSNWVNAMKQYPQALEKLRVK